MTLLFSSLPAAIGKCSHGLLLADYDAQALHVVATDRGRLILAPCDDDLLEPVVRP